MRDPFDLTADLAFDVQLEALVDFDVAVDARAGVDPYHGHFLVIIYRQGYNDVTTNLAALQNIDVAGLGVLTPPAGKPAASTAVFPDLDDHIAIHPAGIAQAQVAGPASQVASDVGTVQISTAVAGADIAVHRRGRCHSDTAIARLRIAVHVHASFQFYVAIAGADLPLYFIVLTDRDITVSR